MSLALRTSLTAIVVGAVALRAAGAQGIQSALAPSAPVASVESNSPAALRLAVRSADAGSTVTTAIHVTNPTADSLVVTPTVVVPDGWSTVLGALPFTLASGAGDLWLVSVRVPAHAPAGTHVVQLRAAAAGRVLVRDSLLVDVRARHAVELSVAERPPYAISGAAYRGTFLVHNSGNVGTTFLLRSTSSLGSPISTPLSVSLTADETKMVRISATSATVGQEARDEVIELFATDAADTSSTATASMRVTIVQKAGAGEQLHTVASTLRLRAARATTGVSPFELIGGGQLRDGGDEQLEFVMRGRTSAGSPFGEREEYRVGVAGANYHAQVGDALYMASPLTSSGLRGFGGGFDVGDSTVGGGAFSQNFRFQPQGGSETGGYLRLGGDQTIGAPRFGLSAVNRTGSDMSGQIFGGTARFHPLGNAVVDMEYADSHGEAGHGVARSVRASGGSVVRLDVGHLDASPTFAGTSRGQMYDYLNLSTQSWNSFQLTATGAHSTNRGSVVGADFFQELRTSMLELAYDNRFSLAYTSLDRNSGSLLLGLIESQQGLIARGEQGFGVARLWGTAETGRATDSYGSGSRPYEQMSFGVSAPVGPHTFSLFGEAGQGVRVLRGSDKLISLGADAQIRIASTTTFAVSGTETRTAMPSGDYAQIDARLTHTLPTGANISMRVRIGGRDFIDAAAGQKLAYLEYSMPLRVPVGPSREPGRVQGRVVDRQTGRGVSGALVRLGPQAAITDADGHVAFAGMPAGAYQLSLAQQLASGSTVFTGNPNVTIDSARRDPVKFSVAVEPAGTIGGSVRRMVLARTGVGASTDSLADGGPLEGITVALAGARDTLYRTTDANGTFTFTDVPSGTWTVIVMGDAPSEMRWELEQIPVVTSAGGQKHVTFRLVPRPRRVRIVAGDGIDEKLQ